MTRPAVRPAVLFALLAAALAAAGCGNRHEIQTHAETEGIYIDVGPLDYQVQISRILNPAIVPDDAYISGIPDYVSPPTEREAWFGVFLRVQNQTKQPHPTAEDIRIVDTQHREYRPVAVDPESNPFVYRPTTLAPNDVLPRPDSVESLSSAQGSLVLFKLPYQAMDNRPLELIIEAPEGGEPAEAKVDLDL